MRSLGKFKLNVSQILVGVAAGLLLLGVACGAAATATPAPKAPAAEALKAPVAPTPVGAAEAKPPAPVIAATPTPAPAATPAPAPTLAAAPKVSPGKLTIMVGGMGNERFDPAFGGGGVTSYGRIIHAFIISSDVEKGRRVLAPGIATKWEISSNGLTWTLTIRKGVKFHDGTDLTAEDVSWSYWQELGPQALKYGVTQTLAHIADRIELTGPDLVSVSTKVPAIELPERISDATGVWYGIVMPKREAFGDGPKAAAYDRNPIAAGPMKLVRHVPVEVMTFERFADYYHQPKNGFPIDKRVNFTLLDLRLVPEEATRIAALRAGEADIAPVSLGARRQVEAGGGRLVFGQEGVHHDITQRGCWKPQFPCHDKRVRQALSYAVDKELIRDKLYGGPEVMQVKGWFAVTPSTIGYTPDLDPFPFDPIKARQLLAEAGYPGGKGFGKLVINTHVSASLPLMPEAAQLGAEFWRRELGLDVEVKVGDRAALIAASNLTEDIYGQILWTDNDTRIDYVGALRNRFGNPQRLGRAHNDPELFDLTNKALGILDPVEREKVLKNTTYPRLREEAYEMNLGYLNIPWGVGPRIRSWEPYSLALYPSALHTITLK